MLNSSAIALLAAGRPGIANQWLPIAIFFAIALFFVGLILVMQVREKKRTAALQQMAEQLGFEFLPKGDAAHLASLDGLPLTSRGRGKKLFNLLRRQSQNMSAAVFDYKYVTGSGRSSRTWQHSVIGFQSDDLALPEFALSPKNMWNKIGQLLGKQSIDFEMHPTFSSKYLLRGANADAVRQLFTEPVLEYFEQNSGWYAEGSDKRLLLYKQGKRVPPAEIATFLENGLNVLSVIHAGTS